MYIIENLIAIASHECATRGLDPKVISALIHTESGWNCDVSRYEAGFRWTFNADKFSQRLGITLATETMHQMTSWGPMQLMGGTARSLGFTGYCHTLCYAEIGISWGCEYFLRNCAKFKTLPEQIASYNAGTPTYAKDGKFNNQAYVDKVTSALTLTV